MLLAKQLALFLYHQSSRQMALYSFRYLAKDSQQFQTNELPYNAWLLVDHRPWNHCFRAFQLKSHGSSSPETCGPWHRRWNCPREGGNSP